jgi:hypothetical protein
MILWVASIALGTSFPCGAQDTSRAAFVYCTWKNDRHKEEWDEAFETLGFTVDKYDNTQVAELAPHLGDYDLVMTSTVFNIENTRDWAPYAADFTEYIAGGGILIITDANYAQTLGPGLSALGAEFSTSFARARTLEDPTPANRELHFGPHPLLAQIPHNLLPLMETATHWAHLVPSSDTWKAAVLDVDEQPVMMYQEYGDGLVVAHNYFGFRRTAVKPLGLPLLENTLLFHQCLQAGIEVTQFDFGAAALGDNAVKLSLRRSPQGQAGPLRLGFSLAFDDLEAQVTEQVVEVPTDDELTVTLPYTVDHRGPLTLSLQLYRDDSPEPLISHSRRFVVPELLSLSAWKRHAYAPTGSLTMEVELTPEPGFDPAAHHLEAIPKVGDVAGQRLLLEAESCRFDVPVDGLPEGEGAVTVRLMHGDEALAASRLPLTVVSEPYVRVDPEGITLVDGEPFFPMGMYIVPHQLDNRERLFVMMQQIAEGGFNVVYTAVRTEEEFVRTLEEAERLGVMMMYGGGTKAEWRETYTDSPRILAWCTTDEPDGPGIDPLRVAESSAHIIDQDSNRPTYVTLCQPPSYEVYCRVADIIAPDPYPVGREAPLSYVSQCMASLNEWLQGDRPVWGVPQAFGGYSSWDVPTPEESRNMTYQFLVHGVRGLIYYTFWDSGFDMLDYPELWEELQRQTAEVQELAPVLLSPEPGIVRQQGPDGVLHTRWQPHEGDAYFMAVNTAEEDLGAVTLDVPIDGSGILRGVFDEVDVPVTDGRVLLDMAPMAVWVLRVEVADK